VKQLDPALLRSQCLIDGAWVGEGVDPIHNPATGALIARVPRFGAAEATQAVEAAQRALGPWSRKTAKERSGRCNK
jgi:succinate-semialdehyde dehydrogenase/glutarate-semialdehyde dehydrogenase